MFSSTLSLTSPVCLALTSHTCMYISTLLWRSEPKMDTRLRARNILVLQMSENNCIHFLLFSSHYKYYNNSQNTNKERFLYKNAQGSFSPSLILEVLLLYPLYNLTSQVIPFKNLLHTSTYTQQTAICPVLCSTVLYFNFAWFWLSFLPQVKAWCWCSFK